MVSRIFQEEVHSFAVIASPPAWTNWMSELVAFGNPPWPIVHRVSNAAGEQERVWVQIPEELYGRLLTNLKAAVYKQFFDPRVIDPGNGSVHTKDETVVVSIPVEWCVFCSLDEAISLTEDRPDKRATAEKKH